MMRKKLKFKKLLNQYRALQYEHEYIKEVLKDAHIEFDAYYRRFCEIYLVNIERMEKKKSEQVRQAFEASDKPTMKGIEEKIRAKDYDHKKIFKQIARKLHPDKLSPDDPRLEEFENDFKTAASGITDGKWGDLFSIAEKHDIDIEDYDEVNKSIKDSMLVLRKKIDALKAQYSYMFYECEDDNNCKDNIIKNFLRQVFGHNL
jgi:hypothetical protein